MQASSQAEVAVSQARRHRQAKAEAPLPEKVEVGKISRMNPFRLQDRKIRTPKMEETRGLVGRFGMLTRVRTVAAQRSLPQTSEIRHEITQRRGLAKLPVRRRECQPVEPVAAVTQ